SGVPLPLLQTNLPIVWVYATVPWIYFVLHWNLLQLLHVHACKLHKIKEHLSGRQILHHLFPLPYSLWQTHAHANGLLHALFALFVHVSTVLLPLGLLLWMQIRFLPYHNQEITWWSHRSSILMDLVLLWIYWPKIKNTQWRFGTVFLSYLAGSKFILSVLLSMGILGFSFLIATYPGEWSDRVFINPDKNKLQNWFPRNLKVTDETLVKEAPSQEILAAYMQKGKTVEEAWSEHAIGLDLSNRDLRYAILTRSKFYNARFVKKNERGPIVEESAANLDHTSLNGAYLKNALLTYVHLRGTFMVGADLQGAYLNMAHLRGADLRFAALQNVDLSLTHLQGADLREAHFQGADFWGAHLQGAGLRGVYLQGADLREAHLQGADLREAQLQGADLREAHFQGADFRNVKLFNNDIDTLSLLWNRWRGAKIQQADEKEWNEVIAEIKDNKTDYKGNKKLLERFDKVKKRLFDPTNEEKQIIDQKNEKLQGIISNRSNEGKDFLSQQAHWLADNLLCTDFYIRWGLVRNVDMDSADDLPKATIFVNTIEKNAQCQTIPDDVPASVIIEYKKDMDKLNKWIEKMKNSKK
ncbi:MAG: pentapeptide repeat-containing protein, partial [Magnetococcales bacterium]|nr:pentapeptide repeat-containing protein [Magnetococcales bacterium]